MCWGRRLFVCYFFVLQIFISFFLLLYYFNNYHTPYIVFLPSCLNLCKYFWVSLPFSYTYENGIFFLFPIFWIAFSSCIFVFIFFEGFYFLYFFIKFPHLRKWYFSVILNFYTKKNAPSCFLTEVVLPVTNQTHKTQKKGLHIADLF